MQTSRLLEETLSVDERHSGMRLTKALYELRGSDVFLVKENGTSERVGTKEWWERIQKFRCKNVAKINDARKYGEALKSCGLCSNHENYTALLNIVVTNMCNLSCWYCFFYPEKSDYLYEPTVKQVEKMILAAKRFNGYTPPVQLTGGEPTLRKDLAEIIRVCKKLGSPHVQLNTNSVKVGVDYFFDERATVEELAEWKRAGLNTIYTSFDGLSEKSNPKNHWEIPYAVEAYRKAGLKSVVLVPTVSKKNLGEVAGIVRLAAKHSDKGIRGVNFQPISLVGAASKREREELRVVQSDIIEELESLGLDYEDWYPVPAAATLADLVGGNKPHVTFYNNEKCGMATYVFPDKHGRKLIPITRFIDVDRFLKDLESLRSLRGKLKAGLSVAKDAILERSLSRALMKKLVSYVIQDELPDGTRISRLLENIVAKGDYESLGEFHEKFLFVGMMHFQDEFNYDVRRVRRCSIHYGSPDGRVIPFCTFNVFPQVYRDRIMRDFGKELGRETVEEIERERGKIREFRKLVKQDREKRKVYEEFYRGHG